MDKFYKKLSNGDMIECNIYEYAFMDGDNPFLDKLGIAVIIYMVLFAAIVLLTC